MVVTPFGKTCKKSQVGVFTFQLYATRQVINKTDLAEAVGASLEVMKLDSARMRDGGPFCFTQV